MFSLLPGNERRELDRFKYEMDRLFERFLDWHPLKAAWEDSDWIPSLDVSETSQAIVVKAELPGMAIEDIEVSLNGNVLTIRGDRKQERENKEENFHRVECRYGSFSRSIRLPADVEGEKVEATYRRGILRLSLPKSKEGSSRKITISTK